MVKYNWKGRHARHRITSWVNNCERLYVGVGLCAIGSAPTAEFMMQSHLLSLVLYMMSHPLDAHHGIWEWLNEHTKALDDLSHVARWESLIASHLRVGLAHVAIVIANTRSKRPRVEYASAQLAALLCEMRTISRWIIYRHRAPDLLSLPHGVPYDIFATKYKIPGRIRRNENSNMRAVRKVLYAPVHALASNHGLSIEQLCEMIANAPLSLTHVSHTTT
jgi:hypothetical protein